MCIVFIKGYIRVRVLYWGEQVMSFGPVSDIMCATTLRCFVRNAASFMLKEQSGCMGEEGVGRCTERGLMRMGVA